MIRHAWIGVLVLVVAVPARSQDVPRPATPPTRTEESQLARLIADRRDPQGRRCELRAVVSTGNLRYLACGDAGVWTVRITPGRPAAEVVDQRATTGIASGFFVRDGNLWVETTTVTAERMAPVAADATVQNGLLPTAEAIGGSAVSAAAATQTPAAPSPTPPPAQPSAAAEPALPPLSPVPQTAAPPATPRRVLTSPDFAAPDAKVVEVAEGFATIDMGAVHGVAPGDHVLFQNSTIERIGPGETAVRDERVAVGVVAVIGKQRTKVKLGVDERVPVGASARPTREPISSSSFSPPRLAGVWEVGFTARPFIVVDNFGVGASLEGRLGYRFDIPLHLEALILPATIATGRNDGVGAFGAIGTASFDTRYFEIGLGVGAQTMNDPAFDLRAGTGTTVAQRLRIGAVDGGMLEAFTYIVLFHQKFEFSELIVHGQLPVGERAWFVINAGGGSLGTGFGEIGVRLLVSGNGDVGSFFVTPTIGGIHVFRTRFCASSGFNCGTVDYAGPHAGFGADWRF